MSASIAPISQPGISQSRPTRLAKPRPGFIATTLRIVWVLLLTTGTLVGGVLWQARRQCPEPCWIDGLTPVEALRGAPKSMPPR
jgi:hypothetical protein